GQNGAEQNPDDWWHAACNALEEIFSAYDARSIAAVCIIGQGPSLIVADDQLRALAPSIIWADQRDHAARALLSERLGYAVSVWSLLPKISWLHDVHPEIFQADTRVLQAYDFIGARLTGHAFASQFGEYPPFSAEEFARAGLDPRWIPPISLTGLPVGVTSAPWCAEAYLPEGIPVIAGVYDAIATTLRAGLV